jgi:hypothetical protein
LKIYVKGKGIRKLYLVQPETIEDNERLRHMTRREIRVYVTLFIASGGKPKKVREWPHGVIISPQREKEEETCPEK